MIQKITLLALAVLALFYFDSEDFYGNNDEFRADRSARHCTGGDRACVRGQVSAR